jgi:hypothetical protein
MDREIEAFIALWMRENAHVLEEILHAQGDNPSTPYGAAMATYLRDAVSWTPGSDRTRH